jgi:hypothetical protein
MNPRIKELADEADSYAKQTVHYYMGQFDGLTWEGKIKQTRDQKFAELIVKECASVSIDSKIDPSGDFREGIAKSIRQYFGVEP